MASVSKKLLDDVITHSVDLLRVAVHLRIPILKLLTKLERDLLNELEDVAGKTDFTVTRMRALLAQTRDTINSIYDRIAVANQAGMVQVATITAKNAVKSINAAINADVASVGMSKEKLEKIASDTLIRGLPSEDWWAGQSLRLQKAFTSQMQMGQLRGETVDQLARRIRGTKAAGFRDGIMQLSKSQADALVRTSVQAVSNAARLQQYANNSDVIKGIQWVSVLDNRTTEQCMALDGLEWSFPDDAGIFADYEPIGHDKEFEPPPLHWNCRSVVVPVTFSWQELADMHGNSAGAQIADQVPEGTRASMDGQVSESTSFFDWLEGRTEAEQNDILGEGKADLFRAGKIDATDLTDQNNRPLSLSELEEKYG